MFRSIAFVSVIALLFFGDITVSTCPNFAETEYAGIKELVAGMTNAGNNEDACQKVFKFVLEKTEENGEDCQCYTEHPLYKTYTHFCGNYSFLSCSIKSYNCFV